MIRKTNCPTNKHIAFLQDTNNSYAWQKMLHSLAVRRHRKNTDNHTIICV